jgi:uncharacterized protein (TIGR02996 family)
MSETALLQALAEDPHDDLARSVYADWLEERGDPRAEFLRLQIALKSLPLGSPGNQPAQDRLRDLRRGCPDEWLRVVEPLALLGELSPRARNILNGVKVPTLGELHCYTWFELLGSRSFGETFVKELGGKLAALGLSLINE